MEDDSHEKSPAAAISTSAVQLMRQYTGRGPTKAKTTIAEDSVLLVMGDTLTLAERRLAENGEAPRVLELRRDFQRIMREDLVEVVERETGRKVIAFMSDNHIDPDFAAEVFLLEPSHGPVSG